MFLEGSFCMILLDSEKASVQFDYQNLLLALFIWISDIMPNRFRVNPRFMLDRSNSVKRKLKKVRYSFFGLACYSCSSLVNH